MTLPIVLWAITASFLLTSGIQPEYHAEGSVLFVNPSVVTATDGSGTETRVNPLLVGSSGLSTAAEVASYAINTPQVARLLESEGLSNDFIVGPLPNTPILLIEATGQTRAGSTATISRVVELIEEDIDIRQEDAGSPENQRVSVAVIDISAAGGADYGGRNRIRIAVIALGAAMAFGAAFFAEGVRRRRALRKLDDSDPSTETDVDPGAITGADTDVDPDLGRDPDLDAAHDLGDFDLDNPASIEWGNRPPPAVDPDHSADPAPHDPAVEQQGTSDGSATGNRSSSKA